MKTIGSRYNDWRWTICHSQVSLLFSAFLLGNGWSMLHISICEIVFALLHVTLCDSGVFSSWLGAAQHSIYMYKFSNFSKIAPVWEKGLRWREGWWDMNESKFLHERSLSVQTRLAEPQFTLGNNKIYLQSHSFLFSLSVSVDINIKGD